MDEKAIMDVLDTIKKTGSPLKRQLLIVALISRLFEERGAEPPVIIGGCALSYYSREVYFTSDIDLACHEKEVLDEVAKRIGFRKEGKYWVSEPLESLIEVPVSRLAGEEAPLETVELGEKLSCRIIGLEDLIIDRVNACVHWKSQIDCEMAELLVNRYFSEIDWDYLLRKGGEPDNDIRSRLEELRTKAADR